MNAPLRFPLPASRAITDVKVTQSERGAAPWVLINWTDGKAHRHGLQLQDSAARELILDLHGYALQGESYRAAYLIGFIRHHMLSQGGG